MMAATRDHNGNCVYQRVERHPGGGWRVTLWFGSHFVTTVTEAIYRTREQARHGDIGDGIGQRGRIS